MFYFYLLLSWNGGDGGGIEYSRSKIRIHTYGFVNSKKINFYSTVFESC